MELVHDLVLGTLPPGMTLSLHPIAVAGWFGFLLTALNLLPLGQLDGGHVLFAASPRLHRLLGPPLSAALLALGVFTPFPGWILWGLLMGLGLGSHPRLTEPEERIGRPAAAARRRELPPVPAFVFARAPRPPGAVERDVPEPLREVLGPGGALSRVLPAYEPRPPQLAMAERVEDALGHGRALLVEAGTGTGKTLAYLLPAARSGLKVVVSTATKTLQEQLAEKDVPLLRALGIDARVAFLKGRQNYLCLLRFEQFHPQSDVRGARRGRRLRWHRPLGGDHADRRPAPS